MNQWAIPLLADPSPCLRRLVLCDLLGRSADDSEVRELADLPDSLVENLLLAQQTDGSWGGELHATTQVLIRLGYLGLGQDHPAVRRGAEFIFSQQQPDGSWSLSRSLEQTDGGSYDLIPLQTSVPLRGLSVCGYAADPRAEQAYEWLLAQRLPDGAWPTGLGGGNYGYVAGYRRLAHSRWGCRTNTTTALVCLAHHPERRTGSEARRALDLVLGRETRERHHVGLEVARMIGVEPMAGRFTYFARFDLALILDLCWRVGASQEDSRVEDIVESLLRWQGAYGLWEYSSHPEVSRWVTFDLLRSLTRLRSDAEWQSCEPRTPFRPYNKIDHRY
ncbi:MAG: hypothetical protein HY866_15965 [Chloroflexi bacterium]|nr:hypothetical protein [Chloroflexota bacterium]